MLNDFGKEVHVIETGKYYISNNSSFTGQVFKILEIGETELRFQKRNRIIKYERWAYRASKLKWYLVEVNKSWETNSGISIFGDEVPEKYLDELNSN